MKVTTAIIFAAGFGTRMLPATSAVQKVLLPILDRPVVDYVVADCVSAGITNIIFVIDPGTHGLQDFYVGNANLQQRLRQFGKTDVIERLSKIHSQATFTFVEQMPEEVGYGTNAAVKAALPHLPENEAYIACNGDAFLWHPGAPSDTRMLIEAFQRTGASGGIVGLEMPESELSRYGVLSIEDWQGAAKLSGLVEKPAPGEAPSNLVNFGLYLFTPEFTSYVRAVKLNESNEYFLTDAILAASQDKPFVVHRAQGENLDAGNLKGWLHANLTVAQTRPELTGKSTLDKQK